MDAERVLDLLGAPFAGKYDTGAGEWLKNFYDHWMRMGEVDPLVAVFRVITPRARRAGLMECIDFIGTTYEEISEHFRTWGSELAASRGRSDWQGFGGHGNGGKFHMRQNFEASEFITYRRGELTVFGFGTDKKYGFDDRYKGTPVEPGKALAIAGIDPRDGAFPVDIRPLLESGDSNLCHFTVVRGKGFTHPGKFRRQGFDVALKADSQAKQVLERARVVYVGDGQVTDPLKPDYIEDNPDYIGGRAFELPGSIEYDGETFEISKEPTAGTLTLRVAAAPFPRRNSSWSIDVLGRRSLIIANYKISELPIHNKAGADFIYGELTAPALEVHGLKQNDRQKLVPNDISEAVLEWVAARIDELSDELAASENTKRREEDAAVTQALSERLNRWKNQFLKARGVWVTVGPGVGMGEGGKGGGGAGGPGPFRDGPGLSGNGKGSGGQGSGGAGREDGGGGAGDEKKRSARFPEIRVSGYDPDLEGSLFHLHPRHPVVYQRTQDVDNNLWWVNAQRSLAERIIAEDGVKSPRWRDYVFNRFVEVIQAYDLKENYDQTSDLSSYLWELIGQIHDSASAHLADVLFEPVSDEDDHSEMAE
jgi:hypothetical protein